MLDTKSYLSQVHLFMAHIYVNVHSKLALEVIYNILIFALLILAF